MMRTASPHTWRAARPWLANTPAGFANAVYRLKKDYKDGLFVVLVKAAASGDWNSFAAAMEQAAGAQSVREVLAGGSTFALSMLYGRTGLPGKFYPLFQATVRLSWEIHREFPTIRPGRHRRMVILNKLFARAEIKALDIPEKIQAALYV